MKERKIDVMYWVEVLYYCILILSVLGLIGGQAIPIGMRWWHGMANVSYKLAGFFGRVGIESEIEYYKAAERA